MTATTATRILVTATCLGAGTFLLVALSYMRRSTRPERARWPFVAGVAWLNLMLGGWMFYLSIWSPELDVVASAVARMAVFAAVLPVTVVVVRWAWNLFVGNGPWSG